MGGYGSFVDPYEKAQNITDRQLEIAKELNLKHFPGQDSPELLSAIIQALATNFAAVVTK